MRKWVVGVVAAIVALGLVAGGAALAAYQTSVFKESIGDQPLLPQAWPQGPRDGDGRLHEYFLNALAEELGMSGEELEARLAGGETLLAIAREQGLDAEALRDLSLQARDKALEAAVADGVITEDQADWLRERGFGPALGLPWCGGGYRPGGRPRGDGMAPGFGPFGGRAPWGR